MIIRKWKLINHILLILKIQNIHTVKYTKNQKNLKLQDTHIKQIHIHHMTLVNTVQFTTMRIHIQNHIKVTIIIKIISHLQLLLVLLVQLRHISSIHHHQKIIIIIRLLLLLVLVHSINKQ